MRIAMGIEYDGASFHGWQRQPHASSVQACVEKALSRVANETIAVQCAGRTDAGVHAAGQVIHFDTRAERSERGWLLGANSILPPQISMQWMRQVDDNFNARFDATARTYRYCIFNSPLRSALQYRHTTWIRQPLDETRMQQAAQYLIGTHDFSAYRALACQAKSPIRTVSQLDVIRHDKQITLTIKANAFLHHMVRNIAGVLIAIGSHEQEPVWAQQILETRDRTKGGVTAAPDGLTLISVDYP
ncbi:MAG TPA: tRNA pseudouridine(38-40) synthase TruA [Gammaproteobacteria bacterium]|nr:tRNA pseudouridine(38-40) synthase TruA [Gammaproteobacteria bacterium]